MKESEKLQAWIDTEKAKGLIDFKFSLVDGADKTKMTLESVAKELNDLIVAPTVNDIEIF